MSNTPANNPQSRFSTPAELSRTETGGGIVYVLENPAMPGYIKLGKTDNLPQRMQRLFDTSVPVPVPFTCYYAARVADSTKVEKSLFETFGDKRAHPRRGLLTADPHRVAAVIKLVELEDVTIHGQVDTSVGQEDTASVNRAAARAERLNFEMLGITIGEELVSVKSSDITCRVVNQRPARVEYEGEVMSLSAAAQKVMNSAWGVQGSQYWIYEGSTLQEIREHIERGNQNRVPRHTSRRRSDAFSFSSEHHCGSLVETAQTQSIAAT